MRQATKKQKDLLNDFAKNRKLRPLLKNKDIDNLSSKEASELITECMDKRDAKEKRNKSEISGRNGFGSLDTVELTDEEEAKVRKEHKEHCKRIMQECLNDHRPNKKVAIAVFEKRADKIFTWLQRVKSEKQMQSKD